MRPELAAALHAAAELLPVSSSAHLRAVGGEDDDVAAHAVPLAVTLIVYRREIPRPTGRRLTFHLVAGGIPSVCGVLVGDRRHRLPAWVGMLGGSLVLASTACTEGGRDAAAPHRARRPGGRARADVRFEATRHRGLRVRSDVGLVDGVALGVAQAAALWPGVSRFGTTLAVARWRGFAADEAPLLAREVGVPVTLGALIHDRIGGRSREDDARASLPRLLPAVAGAVAALPLARRVDRGGSLAPYVAERALVALALLRQSRAA